MNSSLEQYKHLTSKHRKIIFLVIIGALLFAVVMIGLAFTGNELIIDTEKIEITGVYGEEIPMTEIKSIELVEKRPRLSHKIHGFSIGYRKKGYFRTNNGKKIKAIINADYLPWILITKETGEVLYFSSGKGSNEDLYKKLKKTLPDNG